MARIRVLNAENRDFSESARAIIRSFADLEEGELSRESLVAGVAGHDALIVRLAHRVDEAVFKAAPGLRVLVSATTGLDHIDLDAAARRGIEVLSLKGETAFLKRVTATAEHTWGLLLALVRKLPEAVADTHEGHWRRDLFRGSELSEKTLGIVGYGRLGEIVARYGAAFGMNVLVSDVRPLTVPSGVTALPLEHVLAAADVVSLHVPLEPATAGLIGRTRLQSMKRGAVLINTSRGEVVDQIALLEALRSGHIAGAALDVIPDERPGTGTLVEHPLIRYSREAPNLIVTPHIGGATWDSMRKTEEFMAERLREWARGHGFDVR